MDGQGAVAGLVGRACGHLQAQRAAVARRDEGGLEGELGQVRGAGEGSGVGGEVGQGGAGHDDGAVHGVVGQPGRGLGCDPPGEQDGAVGLGGGAGQQGVACLGQSGGGQVTRCGGGVQPVGLALERVGRQWHDGCGDGEQGVPVGGGAVCVRYGQGVGELGGPGTVAAQSDGGGGGQPGRVDGGGDRRGQHGVGAGLDEQPVSLGQGGGDHLVEADGFAKVVIPVGGVQGGGVGQGAGNCGVERDRSAAGVQLREGGHDLVADGIQDRGVGSVADRQLAGGDAVNGAAGEQVVDSGGVAGDDGGVRAVDRRDGELAAIGADQRVGFLLAGGQGGHGAGRG